MKKMLSIADLDSRQHWTSRKAAPGRSLGLILGSLLVLSAVIGFGGSRDLLDINDGEAVAAEIRRYLPDSTVLATTTYDWLYDPFSRGAWPAYRKGVMSGALETMQASEGRFFFAGAATASGWHEWIDGAIESGIRAGREVREALA